MTWPSSRHAGRVVRVLNGNETVFNTVVAQEAISAPTRVDDAASSDRAAVASLISIWYGMSIYFPWSNVSEEYDNLAFNGWPLGWRRVARLARGS